ncbi:stabilizer of axonemal microtubules 1-like [Haliotis rufescens]|uniref:stabilizer of axonemal microtubules 1-like n=1 Tax=Haliotis rufescens TaxID=6454 RepID=UPI00201F6FCA|nr:stabilizer of axonemal microtubules 1-like [Haliotis rufescens]
MRGGQASGDPVAETQICFHNRIVNPVPWRLSKASKNAHPADFLSEYQEAYKWWKFQPPRDPLKPVTANHETNAVTDMQSLYRKDFVTHSVRESKRALIKQKDEYIVPQPKARLRTTYKSDYTEQKLAPTNSFKPTRVYQSPTVKFSCRSVYQGAFEAYEAELARSCRPSLIMPVEGIEVSKATDGKNVSTCQDSFPAHQNVERPSVIIQEDNEIQPHGPFDSTTTYKSNFPKKPTPAPRKAIVRPDTYPKRQPPFKAVSTFMTDYKQHKNARREPSCRPPEATAVVADVPFAKETTASRTYKSWPVQPRENPLWARKAEYKLPQGRLPLSTTYMMDYQNPTPKQSPAIPKVPSEAGPDMITHVNGDSSGDGNTVYRGSYGAWKNARPASPYTPKREYAAPKEQMAYLSTQQSHYRGEQTKRAELCRHISEHRRLNQQKNMYFQTTYKDTYTGGVARPKSSPSSLGSSPPGLKNCPALTCVPCNAETKLSPAETSTNSTVNVSNDSGIDVGSSGEVASN